MKKNYVLLAVFAILFNLYELAAQCTQVAPYTEDFTSSSTPTCWTESGDDNWDYNTSAGYAASSVQDHTAGGGGNYAWVDGSTNTNGDRTTLTSPLVDVSSLGVPALEFYMFGNNTNNSTVNELEVEVYDGSSWQSVLLINTLKDSWRVFYIDLTNYVSAGLVQVRFSVIGSSGASPFYNDILIDDVSFVEAPSCFPVANVAVDAITDVSASVDWSPIGSETMWNIEVVSSGTTPSGTPTQTGLSSPSALVSNLTPQTAYDVYVQADCGGGDFGDWVGPITFETICSSFTAPFLENFEASAGSLPACWELSGLDDWEFANDTGFDDIGDDGDFLGTTSASGGYFAFIDDSGSDGTLTSPLIDISSLSFPGLYFYLISDNQGGPSSTLNIEIFDGTAWNDAGSYTGNTGGWIEEFINLAGYSGEIRIRFNFIESTSFFDDIAIDDVSIREGPSCLAPYDLSVANADTTTAELSWSSSGSPNESDFNVEVVLEGNDPVGIATDAGVSSPFTKTGLQPNTTYDFYVKANCGVDGFSDYEGPYTFTTGCPSSVQAPWMDDVDGHLPAEDFTNSRCWTATSVSNYNWNVSDGDTPTSSTGPSAANSGSGFFYVEATDGAQDDEAALISPMIDLSILSASTPVLSFYYHRFGGEMGDLHVDINDGSGWTNDLLVITGSQQAFAGDDWEQAFVDLTPYAASSNPVQVRFRAIKGAGELGDVALDDFEIKLGNACVEPSGLATANITDTTADVSWTASSSVTSWDLEVVPAGGSSAGVPTDVGVTSNPYALTGLNSNTAYDIYVRSNCGNGQVSDWAGPVGFSTSCAAFSLPFCENFDSTPTGSFSNNNTPDCWSFIDSGAGYGYVNNNFTFGSNVFYMYNSSDGNGDYILTSPLITSLTSGAEVSFEVDGFAGQEFIVGTLSNPSDGASFTPIQSIVLATSDIESYTVLIPSGTDQFIGFKHGLTGTFDSFYFENICIDVAPVCPQPVALDATNITQNSADLSWTAGGNETTWNVEVVQSGVSPSGTPTDTGVSNPFAVTGLSASTSYDYYVQADCGATDGTSKWSGPYSFSTECGAITPPYAESFETFSSGAFSSENCWTADEDNISNDWNINSGSTSSVSTGPEGANSGNNYFHLETSGGSVGSEARLVSPLIDINSLQTPGISFYYHMYGDDTGDLIVDVHDGAAWNNNVALPAPVLNSHAAGLSPPTLQHSGN